LFSPIMEESAGLGDGSRDGVVDVFHMWVYPFHTLDFSRKFLTQGRRANASHPAEAEILNPMDQRSASFLGARKEQTADNWDTCQSSRNLHVVPILPSPAHRIPDHRLIP